MATEKFTQLPTVINSTMSDIIAAVQAGSSVQQTLGQVFDLYLQNTILHNAGNPNGAVAGSTYQLCWDTTNSIMYICTTSGTSVTAVWTAAGSHATIVPLNEGGTNANLTASNGGIVWCNATQMQILAGVAAAGKMLQSGNLATPSWSTPTWPSASGVSGQLVISDGTNNVYSTPTWPNLGGTAGSVVISDGTNKINSTSLWVNTVGSAGKMIRSDGTINTYSTSTFADTYSINTILYASGANTITGLATANSGVLVTSATGVPSFLTGMTDGKLVMGVTGGTPVAGSLLAGAGVSITSGVGTLTIAATGSGIGWNEVTGTSQAMSADTGYIANNAGLVTLTLPTTAAVGQTSIVIGKGAGGWSIAQGVGQNIQFGSVSTTVGVGGSLSSTNRFDSIQLVCTTANTTFTVLGSPQSAGLTIV